MSPTRKTPAVAGDRDRDVELLDRPLSARSILASLLLGMHPPRLDAARLVRWCGQFGVADGTARVALSRMVDRGELTVRDGTYELAGPVRVRQRAQEWALAPDRVEPWSGDWRLGVVDPGPRDARARAALRDAMRVLRHVELREGLWNRPDNLAGDGAPDAAARLAETQCTWWRARPEDLDAAVAAFDLPAWARRARALQGRLVDATLAVDAGDAAALADAFVVGAAALVHVRHDPLLPAALLPDGWPGSELRDAYRAYQQAFGAAVARFLRAG